MWLSNSLIRYWKKIDNTPIGLKMAKSSFWSLLGAFISRGMTLLASIIVARMIGINGFGELGIIQNTIGMFGVFAGLGLGITATKYISEYRFRDPAKAGRIISLSVTIAWGTGLIAAIILYICAPWLAEKTLAAPYLEPELRISSILILLGAVNGVQTGIITGFEAFKIVARINIISGIASFPLMVGGAWLWKVDGAILGMIVVLAINVILSEYAIRFKITLGEVQLKNKNICLELPIIWRFTLPSVIAGTMVGPVNWICGSKLVNQPNGYYEMGIYNAANQWFQVIVFIPAILSSTILPVLSSNGIAGSDSRRVLWLSIIAISLTVIPVAIILCTFGPAIMGLYGKSLNNCNEVLIVVISTAVLVSVMYPVGQMLVADNQMWKGLIMNMGWATAFIVLLYFMLPINAIGLAWARFIAYIFHATWVSVYFISFYKRIIYNAKGI